MNTQRALLAGRVTVYILGGGLLAFGTGAMGLSLGGRALAVASLVAVSFAVTVCAVSIEERIADTIANRKERNRAVSP